MALSTRTKRVLEISMADRRASAELAAAVDSGSNPQAASVALIGVTADLTAAVVTATTFAASAGTYALPAEPTGAEVDTAIDDALAQVKSVVDAKADNVDLETLRTEVEGRLDAIEAKVDAIIAALKGASLMA